MNIKTNGIFNGFDPDLIEQGIIDKDAYNRAYLERKEQCREFYRNAPKFGITLEPRWGSTGNSVGANMFFQDTRGRSGSVSDGFFDFLEVD
jgi:hypothetical protein